MTAKRDEYNLALAFTETGFKKPLSGSDKKRGQIEKQG